MPHEPERNPGGVGDVSSWISAVATEGMSVPGRTESWKRSTNGSGCGILSITFKSQSQFKKGTSGLSTFDEAEDV